MSWEPQADLSYAAKQDVLREYWSRFGPFRFVIETGIWQGQGSCMQFRSEQSEYVAVESNDESATQARERGFDVRTGDSATILPALLAARNEPAFFWLDAHLVAEANEPSHSPLLAELGAILVWPYAARSVVLVDDIRMMGRDGWPTLMEVLQAVRSIWVVTQQDDILRLTSQ